MTDNGHDAHEAMDALRHGLDAAAHAAGTRQAQMQALQTSAEAWAVACLRTHRGASLTLGLEISSAIVHYLAELRDAE